jgi:hypothetical protein
MTMSPLEMALYVVLVPSLVAAITVAAAGWLGRRLGIAGSGQASVALALGLGEIAAQLGNALPAFPPIEVTHRIPWLVLAATLLGLCESVRPSPGWARWENRLLLILLTLAMVLGPVVGEDWPTRESLLRQGGLVLILLFVWANLEALASRRSTAVLGPSLVVVAASAGAALLLSGYLVLGKLSGGLAAALGAVWILSCWMPDRSLSRGGVPVLFTAFAALLIVGNVYSEMPLPAPSAYLLAASPLAAWIGSIGPVRRLASWQVTLLIVVATLVPAGVAVGLAYAASPSYEPNEY